MDSPFLNDSLHSNEAVLAQSHAPHFPSQKSNQLEIGCRPAFADECSLGGMTIISFLFLNLDCVLSTRLALPHGKLAVVPTTCLTCVAPTRFGNSKLRLALCV